MTCLSEFEVSRYFHLTRGFETLLGAVLLLFLSYVFYLLAFNNYWKYFGVATDASRIPLSQSRGRISLSRELTKGTSAYHILALHTETQAQTSRQGRK